MGLFPDLPDDGEPDWSELEALAEEYPFAEPFFEAIRAEAERLYEEMYEPDDLARLLSAATELEGQHLPYVWGKGDLDPVAWAEEIARDAAQRTISSSEEFEERYGPRPTTRLAALSHIEERIAGARPRRPLRWLLRAVRRLRSAR